METRLLVLENRLRQTEEALVAERRASHRTAEVAQQVVRACPAGIDVEEIGGLEMFNGDSDLNGRVSNMPWSQWSLTVGKYFGEFNQTATPLLQRVETNAEDSIITDNTTMTRAETRLSTQLYCVLALTRKKRALQVVQQVPRVWRSSSWPGCQAPQRKCAGLLSTTIKEVEGVRQQEEQEDKRDEEEGDEVNGEVERNHSSCA